MEKGFLDSGGRGSNHKKKKGFSGANAIGSTDSNFATGLSTTTNDPTRKNVGVEAGNSKERLGNTSNVVTPMSNHSDMLNGKPIVVANVPNDADYDVWLPLALVHEIGWIKLDCHENRYPNEVRLIDKLHVFEIMGVKKLCKSFVEINACNDFSDNLVMVVPNLEGTRYTKETIHIEYEWE
nr:hypothetical protein [Tanacetum cinerariifolium]